MNKNNTITQHAPLSLSPHNLQLPSSNIAKTKKKIIVTKIAT